MEPTAQSRHSTSALELLGLAPTQHLAEEIALAAQTGTAVLISGRREAAAAAARRVHNLKSPRSAFVALDCGQAEEVVSARLTDALDRPRAGHTVFLQDVDRLSRPLQALVVRHLTHDAATLRPQAVVQIIASTTVSLLARVREGAFDERLFYRLNTVHIVVT